ncbi:ABC transporter permease [Leucobacter luti]|uniref:Peptide/nickel transport system permease protein n=1 Tax=Leucobacter luti TaxID=340320 RepID=A0A4Q7U7W0_9MICO|nr:ABC transporter permease [Leucobacter luti]MBL3700658.1 ABC transporter permease [Leucobacter luti]RZT68502.1 peptide/nickel transport system permease protein [Leucobacter luti]
MTPRTRQITLLNRVQVGTGRSRDWVVVIATVFLALVVLAALASPFITDAATKQSILDSLLPPGSPGHPLGTDELGRDVLLLTLAGTGSAVAGPLVIAAGSMVLAIAIGTLAGYLRGSVDWVVGRVVDVLLSLPVMLVALVVAGIFGAGYWVTVVMLVLLFSPSDIRIVRAGVTEQAPRPYVEAAQMLSLSPARIMYRHIVPNVWPLIMTNFMLNLAVALVTLSSLSFLGIGVAPGTPDWGRQITDGRGIIGDNPAMLLVPAILIVLVAMAINVLGDHLGERLRERGMQ